MDERQGASFDVIKKGTPIVNCYFLRISPTDDCFYFCVGFNINRCRLQFWGRPAILNAMVYNLERRKKCTKERTDKRTRRVPFTRDWLEKGKP